MLQLICPDGSIIDVLDHTVIGRATDVGGLSAVPAASRKQLELRPVIGVEDALCLKALGQNCKSVTTWTSVLVCAPCLVAQAQLDL